MSTEKIDYQKYLKSDYWQEIRKQIYERDNYKCRLCNSEKDICVHHRTYKYIGEEKLEELITMCKRCHNKFHKVNPEINYKYYIRQIELENRKQKDEIELERIREYIINNEEKFNIIKNTIDKNNYMLHSEFIKELKKIMEETFDENLFFIYIKQYLQVIEVVTYDKDIKNKYNLPKRETKLMINKSLFDEELYKFHEIMFIQTL